MAKVAKNIHAHVYSTQLQYKTLNKDDIGNNPTSTE